MESVIDTQAVEEVQTNEIYENVDTEICFPDSTETVTVKDIEEETETESLIYYTSDASDVVIDNNQSADIVVCLVVIIAILGIVCGISLSRILWGRIK